MCDMGCNYFQLFIKNKEEEMAKKFLVKAINLNRIGIVHARITINNNSFHFSLKVQMYNFYKL